MPCSGGVRGGARRRSPPRCGRRRPARSPSALFTTTRSASSMIPRLSPWSSSPPPGATSTRNRSTIAATLTSDCPTPTVSTSTTSKPAASHNSMASRVRRATPPRVPPVGEGRTNARGDRLSCSMRVLSPRIDPPLRVLDGSTANTATRCSCATRKPPSASMKVDLPAPGAPEMPTRMDFPACGSTSSSSASASAR